MSAPAPLQAFLGGVGLAIPVHDLLTLNGSVFGISGFLHGAVRGSSEAITSFLGLLLGGAVVGLLQNNPPEIIDQRFSTVILSGFLVGMGTKLGGGCTSGHMVSGLSRLSLRSTVATVSFFLSGVITTQFLHRTSFTPIDNLPYDWTLGKLGKSLIILQAVPMAISTILHLAAPKAISSSEDPSVTNPLPLFRHIAALTTAFQFSLALRLSGLSSPSRVLRFLVTPLNASTFDPSLAFLALGALPLTAALYHFFRGTQRPRLGGPWKIPQNDTIDVKLVLGAALFGVGWAIQGICPGPAIVNLGTSFVQRDSSFRLIATWLGSLVAGGLVVSSC